MLDRRLFSAPARETQSLPVFPLPRLDMQPPVLLVLNHADLAIDVAYERIHVPGGPFVRTSTRETTQYCIPRLTPVFAVSDGKLLDAREESSGHRLIIDHENSWFTIYGGLEQAFVRPHERCVEIRAGDPLGYMGWTRDGPLRPLRFELWRVDQRGHYEQIDPIRHMRRWKQVAWRDDPLPCKPASQVA